MKMRRARKTLTVRHGVVRECRTWLTQPNGIKTTRWHWVVKQYMTRKGESK